MKTKYPKKDHAPVMMYEGDRNKPDELVCVWSIDGKEVFRHPYSNMAIYASMINCHFLVRLAILHWAERIVRPD
jgi:hypothetical protein